MHWAFYIKLTRFNATTNFIYPVKFYIASTGKNTVPFSQNRLQLFHSIFICVLSTLKYFIASL